MSLRTTILVYDALGQMVAEYDTATPTGSGGTSYLTSDNLGTPRVITDANGNVQSRHDYAPFGEELGYNQSLNLRSSEQKYVVDNVRQKFATYERDSETGLDYAQARYYGSMLGRFTSPDDFLNDAHASDPASWNLYVYVRNNPLRYIDPFGQTIENTSDPNRWKLSTEQLEAIAADLRKKTGLSSIAFNSAGRLTYDANEKAKGGSAKLREAITVAINDQSNIFALSDASGTAVNFMDTDAGTTTQYGDGRKTNTFQVSVDFGDYANAAKYSDADALEAYSLGVGLYHETNHKVSYDPFDPIIGPPGTQRDDVTGEHLQRSFMQLLDRPGVIQNEAAVASQLGLPRRDNNHVASRGPNGTYQISFTDGSGKQKFVRWRLEGAR